MNEPTVVKQKRRLKHHIGRCWFFLGIVIVVMAIVFTVFRALTPWARQYKPQIEQHLSAILEQPVTIGSMETSWYWFQPVLRLNQVSVTDDQSQTLKLKKILVGINLFRSLLHWKLQPGILYADHSHITLRQVGQHWELDGLKLKGQDTNFDPTTYLRILMGLSAQDKIILRHITLLVHLNNGITLPLTHLNLTVKNWGGDYRIKGLLQLVQNIPTEVSVSAELKLDADHFNRTKGRIYLAIHSLDMSQWEDFFPNGPVKIKSGDGDVTVWLDVNKGGVSEGQSTLQLHHLVIKRVDQKALQKIDLLSANLGWRRTKDGWELEGDHLKLNMNRTAWPENAFFIHHYEAIHGYRVFIKHLLIKPLLAMNLPSPDVIKPILIRNPKGQLYDTELNFREQSIDYLLTGFTNLAWSGTAEFPGVRHLSGVLYWQPHEGRLELDSYDAVIKPQALPPVTFSQINTAIEWKPLKNGQRITLEHLVLQNPDLTLTANGVLDEPDSFSTAHLHLTSQFSATDAEQWLKYIPSAALKPKLDQWLKRGIKNITKITAHTIVDGAVADFPFDRSAGQFEIKAELQGIDFYINPKWPLTRDVDAFLKMDKRDLNINIHHANLQGVSVDNMNLRIDDIGLDYETLLIHGKIKAQAQKMLAYVFDSPLNDHLSRLKPLKLEGLLGLDLKIEIPLYPQNDVVLTQGEVTLENNQLALYQGTSKIVLDNLTGLLTFNEKGILKSTLQSTFGGNPLTMMIHSIKKPKPSTEVILGGSVSIDTLRETAPLPLFDIIKGKMRLNGVLTLTDDPNDYDHLLMRSTLKGVRVDLPVPFGKAANAALPLKVSVDFNDKKPLQVQVNYGEKLTGVEVKATKLEENAWAIQLEQQNISANVRYQLDKHTLTGELARLHIPKSEAISSAQGARKLTPENIPNLHLTVQKLIYDDLDLGQAVIVSKSTKTNWTIESLKLTSPEYEFYLKGSWTKDQNSDHTDVQGELNSNNLAKSLERWHIKSDVQANKGTLLLEAGWPGFVSDFSLAKVRGKIQVEFKDGRITDLSKATEEKLGIGKVLNIFSLQTIPRRLKLDFSDLSKQGYTFDQFKGDFQFAKGVMSTQNSAMDGPVASVTMKGDLNLVKHMYDLSIYVSPHVMASLPAVITMAPTVLTIGGGPIIGPVAGAAAWVAGKIITKVMYKVTGYTYKVTGPWQDPVVEQVSIFKKRVKG